MDLEEAIGLRTTIRQLADQATAANAAPQSVALEAAEADNSSSNFVSIGVSLSSEPRQAHIALRFQDDPLDHLDFIRAAREAAGGEELDIGRMRVIRAINGCGGTTPVSGPLAIGASVGYRNHTGGGTIGFFARRHSDRAEGLVSNNHVIALGDRGAANDEVLHPSACDGGSLTANVIARLQDGFPKIFDDTRVKLTDCAFAKFENVAPFDTRALHDGIRLKKRGARLTSRDIVFKIGRTTGVTTGIVRAVRFDTVPVTFHEFSGQVVRFANLIEIETIGPEPFSAGGDSGSLVYDRRGAPVGLLFADTQNGGRRGFDRHYAIPISNVLTELDLEIL